MEILQVKEDYVGTWIVDGETGRIISLVKDERVRPKIASFDKYVGIDTKFPANCLTEDSLLNALTPIDAYVKDKNTNVNTAFLLNSVLAGCLNKAEVNFIMLVANNLSGWNYYMTTMQSLIKSSGIDKFAISKVIKKLSPNTIRVQHKDKPNKGCVVLKLNPLIAWRGDLIYRENAQQLWCIGR